MRAYTIAREVSEVIHLREEVARMGRAYREQLALALNLEDEAERAACLAWEYHVALRCAEETHDAARHDLREENA